jgi:hypothetical protein
MPRNLLAGKSMRNTAELDYAPSGGVAFFVRLDALLLEVLLALFFVFVAAVVVERLRVAGFDSSGALAAGCALVVSESDFVAGFALVARLCGALAVAVAVASGPGSGDGSGAISGGVGGSGLTSGSTSGTSGVGDVAGPSSGAAFSSAPPRCARRASPGVSRVAYGR